jgi:WD40 repeat protein
MVLFSSGSDCNLKVWDIGSRKCVKTFGPELNINKKLSNFHKDSITAMDVVFDADVSFTGGRDGTIFKTNLVDDERYQKIYSGDPKKMITCLKYDE